MAEILIVDNNEHIAGMFREVLAEQGHHVAVIDNGLGALELIKHNKFDIAFIDLELPDISGLDILRSIQENSPQTVSSIISGKNDINYAIEAIKAGVFRYLKKPFDIEDILGVTKLACQKKGLGIKPGKITVIANIFNKLNKKKLLKPILDLPFLILALAVGFLVQKQVFSRQEIPVIWAFKEMLYVIISYVCCYGFVYMRSLMTDYESRAKTGQEYDFKILAMSYVMFAAILYFFSDFVYGRLVLVTGFFLGMAGLWLNRNFLYPALQRLAFKKQDGPKKLVFKGLGQSSPEIIIEKEKIHNYDGAKPQGEMFELSDISYSCDDQDTVDDWGSRLINEFNKNRSQKYQVVQPKRTEEATV